MNKYSVQLAEQTAYGYKLVGESITVLTEDELNAAMVFIRTSHYGREITAELMPDGIVSVKYQMNIGKGWRGWLNSQSDVYVEKIG